MTNLLWTCLLGLAITSFPAGAETIAYRVTGDLNKDADSDPIYRATSDVVRFQIDFEADASSVVPVAPGAVTNLPNFPGVRFTESGFHIGRGAIKSMSFQLSSGTARFSLEDVIGDPSSPGAIFLTGSLRNPTAVHVLLASSQSGYFEIGLPECARTCRLKDGIVLDAAGPFGRVSNLTIIAAGRRR